MKIIIHLNDNDIWYCDPCYCKPQYAKAVRLRDNNNETSYDYDGIEGDIDSVQCVLCPRKGGVLKLADNKYWVHIVCVLYMNKCKFNENGNGKINGVHKLLRTKNKNKCYLCHCIEGYTIKCNHNECNMYFHVLCNIFSGSLMNGNNNVFCRKHTPILQISGGIHYIYENMKLLKLRKTYSEILNILHVLKQKQFRNKYIIQNIENKISNGLPMTPPITQNIQTQIPSTPSDQLIIDENENDKHEMSDSDNDIDIDNDLNNNNIHYEEYINKKNKYKYKMSMINGMKQLYNNINVNDNDSDSDNESSDNNSIININELPNYTNEGID
eukprot:427460_1